LQIELPIEITEQKKKKMEKIVKINSTDQNGECLSINKDALLILNLKNLSHIRSWFAKEHPNYIEGGFVNREEVDKKELKMGFGRAKRILANCDLQINSLNEIFRFKFPKLSYICLIVRDYKNASEKLIKCFIFIQISLLIVLTADMNNILSYLIMTMIFLIVFNIPELSFQKENFLYKFILGSDNLSKDYVPPTFETISHLENMKFKDIERLRVKLKDKDKDKDSLFTKYRNMKKSIAKVQIIITTICNFLEKTKNLLLWKDPQRTTYFLILIFILYVFVSRLPIRIFMVFGGLLLPFFFYFLIILFSFG